MSRVVSCQVPPIRATNAKTPVDSSTATAVPAGTSIVDESTSAWNVNSQPREPDLGGMPADLAVAQHADDECARPRATATPPIGASYLQRVSPDSPVEADAATRAVGARESAEPRGRPRAPARRRIRRRDRSSRPRRRADRAQPTPARSWTRSRRGVGCNRNRPSRRLRPPRNVDCPLGRSARHVTGRRVTGRRATRRVLRTGRGTRDSSPARRRRSRR